MFMILVMLGRQKYTNESLLSGPSHLEVEISIAELKKYKSPGSGQIPAELYQAGGETLASVIHKPITSVWNKEEMPDQWKESIIVPIHKKGDKLPRRVALYACIQQWIQTDPVATEQDKPNVLMQTERNNMI
jgi:hypothetical protein